MQDMNARKPIKNDLFILSTLCNIFILVYSLMIQNCTILQKNVLLDPRELSFSFRIISYFHNIQRYIRESKICHYIRKTLKVIHQDLLQPLKTLIG